MARVGTALLNIGTWVDGENAGAGSQSVDNTGLNGNFIKIDTAVGTEHNANGTHKSAVIDGANLKTTVADGSTIEQDGATKKLKVKDGGITAAKMAASAVATATILDANVTAAKLASDAVTTVKILDANVTLAKMANDSVDATKITHDNKRTKTIFSCYISATNTYAIASGAQLSATFGVPMIRAGSITAKMFCTSGGATGSATTAYGTKAFVAGSFLSVRADSSDQLRILGGVTWDAGLTITAYPCLVTIEVEFDD